MKVEQLTEDDMREMISDELVRAHRLRRLSPDAPVLRGTAQNPDVFFQARETCNPYYAATPAIVQKAMDRFAGMVGPQYHLFDYLGAPDAERVIVLMGSGAEAAHEAVEYLTAKGEKIGIVKVRLYRPFSVEAFLNALPATVRTIGVLDRTKEPGAAGEPLYLDTVTALNEAIGAGIGPLKRMPRVVGGRYGLSSKEFPPAVVKGVFDELRKDRPKNHFVAGIVDDVTGNYIEWDPSFSTEGGDVPADFAALNARVLEHVALRGNVETELAGEDESAGCGCGYPDWVGDAEVARSNAILAQLRETARRFPDLRARLGALPMHAVARVGRERVAIVHGDAWSLAGWAFAQERLRDEPAAAARAFDAAGVRVFASSHTCLPVFQPLDGSGGRCLIANNGAAGMPNFRGTRYGVATRISVHPGPDALYGEQVGAVRVEAIAVISDGLVASPT